MDVFDQKFLVNWFGSETCDLDGVELGIFVPLRMENSKGGIYTLKIIFFLPNAFKAKRSRGCKGVPSVFAPLSASTHMHYCAPIQRFCYLKFLLYPKILNPLTLFIAIALMDYYQGI